MSLLSVKHENICLIDRGVAVVLIGGEWSLW
jgi:hypothetical protein